MERAWGEFVVDDVIDAKDTEGKWYESRVMDVKEDHILVHYNGWSSKWDEWHAKGSSRLAAKNTHTTGPHIPGMASYHWRPTDPKNTHTPGSHTLVQQRAWNDFAVDDVIDVQDTEGKWYESRVMDVKANQILVHYNGWSSKWDAWHAKDSLRLAAKNTHTTGPHIPGAQQAFLKSRLEAEQRARIEEERIAAVKRKKDQKSARAEALKRAAEFRARTEAEKQEKIQRDRTEAEIVRRIEVAKLEAQNRLEIERRKRLEVEARLEAERAENYRLVQAEQKAREEAAINANARVEAERANEEDRVVGPDRESKQEKARDPEDSRFVEFWVVQLRGVLDEEDIPEAASKLSAGGFKQKHIGDISRDDLKEIGFRQAVIKDFMKNQHLLGNRC